MIAPGSGFTKDFSTVRNEHIDSRLNKMFCESGNWTKTRHFDKGCELHDAVTITS